MKKWLARTLAVLLPAIVVAGTIWFCLFLIATSPETERKAETRLPPLVSTVQLEAAPFIRTVEAYGTVIPAREVSLSAEVQGRVLELHPALQPGGILRAGESLLRIDPEEYKLAVSRAESALAETQAALKVEEGRQRIAEREWELFGKEMPDAELGRNLMLRGPQLEQAKAKIDSAKSEVAQAQLNLKRTEILVPFDGIVLEENVELGQRLSTNSSIAMLAGTESFWIRAAIPAAHLSAVLDAAAAGATDVKVFADVGTGMQPTAAGRLLRHLGQVDPEGRMAQLLIEVADPLALGSAASKTTPLPLNSYVRLELNAGTIPGVLRVPREGMRENNQVWVVDESEKLQVKSVEEVWRDEEYVAIKDTLGPQPRVIVSALEEALPGMTLRSRPSVAEPEPADAEATASAS